MASLNAVSEPSRREHLDLEPPRWDALYYRELADSLARLAEAGLATEHRTLSGARVLDVGCGRGELMATLRGAGVRAVGVDLDFHCAAAARPHGPTIQADVVDLARIFPAGAFDVVICSHVLEHVPNPREAVAALEQLTRRWLIIGVPNLLRPVNWFLRRPRYVNAGHLHGWDSHHLKTFLERACQLQIVRWWGDPVTLPPLRRTFLLDTPPLRLLENVFLPRLFPQLVNTLVVLCDTSLKKHPA